MRSETTALEARRVARPAAIAAADGSADEYVLLDRHSDSGLATEAPRLPALAIISAGRRGPARGDRPGYPEVSRDGTIYVSDPEGRAPALAAALAKAGGKRLTIALPQDDLRSVLRQGFFRWNSGALEAYGDADGVTEILVTWGTRDGKRVAERVEHRRHARGTPEYLASKASMQPSWFLQFLLAEWTEGGRSEVIMDDGLGVYVLRTGSHHSASSLVGSLKLVAHYTRGRLAGVPLELAITYRDVAGPDGAKRRVPIWTATLRPPEGIRLTSATFETIVGGALEEGERMRLRALPPGPSAPEELGALGPSEEDLERMEAGDVADVAYWARRFAVTARGTWYGTDEGRAAFMGWATNGGTTSLAEFLASSTNDDADALLAELVRQIADDPGGGQYHNRATGGRPRPAPDAVTALVPVAASSEAAAAEAAAPEAVAEAAATCRLCLRALEDGDVAEGVCGDCVAEASDDAPAEEPAAEADPPPSADLAAVAERAVAELAELLRQQPSAERGRNALDGQVKALRQVCEQRMGLSEDATRLLLRAAFPERPVGVKLSAAEGRAFLMWAAHPEARDQVAALLAHARAG